MRRPAPALRCRIDHTAAGSTGSLVLCQPGGQLEARRTSEVPAVLSEAEAAAHRGYYVAGFVAYDAAPAFDAAFRVPGSSARDEATALPLAWFGLFAEASPAPPLARGTDRPTEAAAEPAFANWGCEIDGTAHGTGVGAIRKAIAAGDTYLVNYTTRFRRPWDPGDDPFELYRHLVAGYGGGYHAYIESDEWVVACGSPELFFEQSGRVLVTRPIKGTAPRGRWAKEDAEQAETLRTSPKEQAENVMVVDLLRNDLGRIALPGTVAVPALGTLEQHPALWQLTSTVTATTPADIGLADAFGALFPCASVTGAPKVSTMALIADREPSARGVYCGAVGFLAPTGHAGSQHPVARFAVAIRTAMIDHRQRMAEYGSGGGITWDSNPQVEWEEVLLKARALTGSAPPSLDAGHGLLETMGWVPTAAGGKVRHLHDHLTRLVGSARYFGVELPTGIEDMVAAATVGLRAPARVRLVLRGDGNLEIDTTPLAPAPTPAPGPTLRLCVDSDPVSSTDVRLFHKTTDRRPYEERARRHPDADDVVLVNERHEVTETTRANVAVRLGGRWCTPPLDCGLLPGVARAQGLADGRLVERVVTVDDLYRATHVATLSSLRGWRPARVQAPCPCRSTTSGPGTIPRSGAYPT